ncbi:MAG: serine protease [Desulfobacterales bacterium]|nr:serine protease [Desulfobacterales bacterium]
MSKYNTWLLIALFLLFPLQSFSEETDKRIINGDKVTSLAYPWMAELVDLNLASFVHEYFCGAALIAPQWLVTAAHCMERALCYEPAFRVASDLEVVIGSYDLSLPQQRVKVSEIIKHPDYNCDTVDSDIALLKLETPVDLPTLRIAFSDTPVGAEMVSMGWGTMNPTGGKDYPDILREIRMKIVSASECNSIYTDYEGVTDNMMCAIAAEEKKGTCYGDSGGPLVVKKGDWFLTGITSWAWDECAVPGYPTVFTRVSQFTDFLKQHIPEIQTHPYITGYDFNNDGQVGLQDAVYVIRSIAVENSDRDISDAIEILKVAAGVP